MFEKATHRSSRRLAAILTVAVAGALPAAAEQVPADKPTEQIELKLGERKIVGRLRITFLGIVEDSRCPGGEDCGETANAQVRIRVGLDQIRTPDRGVHLNTHVGPSFLDIKDTRVTLVDLQPVPVPREPIDPPVATILIEGEGLIRKRERTGEGAAAAAEAAIAQAERAAEERAAAERAEAEKAAAAERIAAMALPGGLRRRQVPLKPGKQFAVPIGSYAANADLRVEFRDVTEDSRCPLGADCIQAGHAAVKVELFAGTETRELELKVGAEPSTATIGGWTVRLKRVHPVPTIGVERERHDYVAVFDAEMAAATEDQ